MENNNNHNDNEDKKHKESGYVVAIKKTTATSGLNTTNK